MKHVKFWCALALFCGIAVSSTPVAASPWTLPQDEMAVGVSYDFQFANTEFLPDGTRQQFPLDGSFTSSRLATSLRYGFTDRFEGALSLSVKHVSFDSQPFLKGKGDDEDFGTRGEVYDKRLVDFSETQIGAANFHFAGRYNIIDHNDVIKLTSDTEIKLPAGYESPEGTFESDTPDSAIRDDVTLGDGQVDLTQQILFGAYFPSSETFTRVGAGYNLRFGTPGDQFIGDVKIGQNIGDSIIVFAGSNGAYTLFDGESIGKSFITRSPEKSPRELTGDDIEPIDISLDKSYLEVSGGMIFRLESAELQVRYGHVVLGNNIAQSQTVSVNTVFSFEGVTSE